MVINYDTTKKENNSEEIESKNYIDGKEMIQIKNASEFMGDDFVMDINGGDKKYLFRGGRTY